MIIVTRRLSLPKQLEAMIGKRWGVHTKRPLTPFKTLHDLRTHHFDVVTERRHQLVVFDLESIVHDHDAAVKIIEWLAKGPWIHAVLVLTTTQIREQVVLLNAIKTAVPQASMVFGADVGSVDVWDDIYSRTITTVQGANLYRDLVQRVLDRQEILVEQELVIDILGAAPRTHQVGKLARLVGRTRGVLWKQLTNAGQLEPSELLTLFHLLYAVHLRDLAWTPEVVARYLQFPSNREFVRRMTRRLGTGIGVFFTRPYAEVMDWASRALAVQSTVAHGPCGVCTLKESAEQFATIVKPAVRIVLGSKSRIRTVAAVVFVGLINAIVQCDTLLSTVVP